MTTPPCTECRRLRKRCKWPSESKDTANGQQSCLVCVKRGRECSGPVRLKEAPCDSCRRSKVRCVWEQSDRCNRCIEHGSTVCPMPPRKRLSRSPKDTTETFSLTCTPISRAGSSSEFSAYSPRSVELAEAAYGHSAINALVQLGSMQLRMVGLTYLGDQSESHLCLDKFCQSLVCLAGLMFTERSLAQSSAGDFSSWGVSLGETTPRTLSSTSVLSGALHMLPPALRSKKQHEVKSVVQAIWVQLHSIRQDRKNVGDRDWWLKYSGALRLIGALRLVPESPADRELLRVSLTETGVQCLQYARETDISEEKRAELRTVARCLMVEEASLACVSRKASLFPDLSAAATLPVLAYVAPWSDLSLDMSSDSIRTVLLPPATCCIARTAHGLAANHYASIESLLVALSELKIAHEHARKLSEALVHSSDGPPSDPSAREMARSVIKTSLWALEVWTNLLVKVKEEDTNGSWPEAPVWLAAQVLEVERHVAEACDSLLYMFDCLADLYQGCDLARTIIQVHLSEFPETCMPPGVPSTERLV